MRQESQAHAYASPGSAPPTSHRGRRHPRSSPPRRPSASLPHSPQNKPPTPASPPSGASMPSPSRVQSLVGGSRTTGAAGDQETLPRPKGHPDAAGSLARRTPTVACHRSASRAQGATANTSARAKTSPLEKLRAPQTPAPSYRPKPCSAAPARPASFPHQSRHPLAVVQHVIRQEIQRLLCIQRSRHRMRKDHHIRRGSFLQPPRELRA